MEETLSGWHECSVTALEGAKLVCLDNMEFLYNIIGRTRIGRGTGSFALIKYEHSVRKNSTIEVYSMYNSKWR